MPRPPLIPPPSPEELKRLLRAIQRGSRGNRWEAAKQLAKHGPKVALKPCLELLQHASRPEAREAAAWVLGALHDERAAPALRATVSRPDETVDVRGQAAEALGDVITNPDRRRAELRRSAQALMPLLREPAPELRFWAAFSLRKLRWRPAVKELKRLARTDRALCPGFWTVGEEAEDAYYVILTGRPRVDFRELVPAR